MAQVERPLWNPQPGELHKLRQSSGFRKWKRFHWQVRVPEKKLYFRSLQRVSIQCWLSSNQSMYMRKLPKVCIGKHARHYHKLKKTLIHKQQGEYTEGFLPQQRGTVSSCPMEHILKVNFERIELPPNSLTSAECSS